MNDKEVIERLVDSVFEGLPTIADKHDHELMRAHARHLITDGWPRGLVRAHCECFEEVSPLEEAIALRRMREISDLAKEWMKCNSTAI